MTMTTNANGLRYQVEAAPGDTTTTIAHLALNSFHGRSSDALNIYQAAHILLVDWRWELEASECEYLGYHQATFKDGSRLTICAWGSDDDSASEQALNKAERQLARLVVA